MNALLKKALPFAIASCLFPTTASADQLDDILDSGVLRVGTTGDYKPFSHFHNNEFNGYDIDVAYHFAKTLGVKVEFVQTTWKGLLSDLEQNKYDIAMGGITRKIQRQLNAEQTQGYMTFGKCFLARKGEGNKFDTLKEANTGNVKVGMNIGGTNEAFAEQFLTSAQFTKYENNLDVPEAVAAGKVDIMVTETPEALYYQVKDKRLEAVSCTTPFTKSQFGYLIPKGEQRFLNTVNFIMDEMTLKGIDQRIMIKNELQ
ncbi:transporter substrate-binding domain-containing protein [Vibrio sp.]|nr:transporter substrate-binding domain-containing protein [Vibrio sp.]